MHPNSAHLLLPLYPPLISATHAHIRRQIKVHKQDSKSKKKTKTKNPQQNKTKSQQQKNLLASPFLPLLHLFTHPGGIRGFRVPYSLPAIFRLNSW